MSFSFTDKICSGPVAKYKMDCNKPYSSPVMSGGKLGLIDGEPFPNPSEYRSVVGALEYLTWIRSDIAFAVNQAYQFMHNSTTTHWTVVKRIFQYIKGTITHGLTFNNSSSLALICFSNVDKAKNSDDRLSISGQYTFLENHLILWSAKKQLTVAKSTTESEYMSHVHTATELSWILYMLMDYPDLQNFSSLV